MSVINKMLRDLDKRQVAQPTGPVTKLASGLTTGTAILGMPGSATAAPLSLGGMAWRLAAVALVALVMGAVLYRWWATPAETKAVKASASQAESQVVLPSLAEPSQARLVVSAAGVGQATAKATPTPKAQALSLPIQALPVGPPTPAEPNTTPVRAVALAASRPASVPAVALNAPLKPTRQAAMEALAQAQALWNDGAHSGALELLKVAIIRLEALPPVESATMAALVRDYVRMALAQGQALEAVGLLERLEPQLSGVADVWALRGNAAQRLGRHQEAVNAYLKALLQRPDEARWMLGAAVSLAALGQTAQAGDLAEKARATGALKPDVAAYLRQLGVVVRQD